MCQDCLADWLPVQGAGVAALPCLCTGEALCTVQTPCAALVSFILLQELPSRVLRAWHSRCPGESCLSFKVVPALPTEVHHQSHVNDTSLVQNSHHALASMERRLALQTWVMQD